MKITRVQAREILDSRGNPTVEADVTLADGAFGRAAVPSGASTGEREALELRDGDKARYSGKGVRKAVAHVNGEIAAAVAEPRLRSARPRRGDGALDGTPTKGRLGANALLGVSMARAAGGCRVAAAAAVPCTSAELYGSERFMLPVPMMNILNGGAHADSSVDFQEFMVMPVGAPSFAEALRIGAEIFHTLRGILKARGQSTGVGDEGGFAPNLRVQSRGVRGRPGGRRQSGHEGGHRHLHRARRGIERAVGRRAAATPSRSRASPSATSEQMIRLYEEWLRQYPIISIEDGLAESDWDGWKALTQTLGNRVQLVGDDVFVTNPEILKRGIADGVGNALLVKLNQIGTVTETLDAVAMARDARYATIISHRSGETEDATIADLAVGTAAGQIKTGSASRTDRVCKYNQLLRIEEELGAQAVYAGRAAIAALDARRERSVRRQATGQSGRSRRTT